MKFVAKAADLSAAFERAALGLDNKIQAYANVHVKAVDGHVHIRSNAVDHSITAIAEAEVETEGETTVHGERVTALVKGFPAKESISFTSADTGAVIACGRARYRIAGIPIDDPPSILTIRECLGEITLARDEVLQLLAAPLPFASRERTRVYLCGICLHDGVDGHLVGVGTDTRRLLRTTVSGSLSDDRRLVVPVKSCELLGKLLRKSNDVELVILRRSQTLFEVATAEFTFTTVLVDCEYPIYERLIPGPSSHNATVEQGEFKQALVRLAAAVDPATNKYLGIAIEWDDGDEAVMLSLLNQPFCTEFINARTEGSCQIAVALSQFEDIDLGKEIRLTVVDNDSPIVMTNTSDTSTIALVLPLRWQFQTEEAA
jgi:DNA polymerase-3 subunit beta